MAAIATAAAAAIGAMGAIAQGQTAKKQATFRAAVQQQQALRERQQAAADEGDFRRRQSRLMAERRAALGASGVEMGTGSPLLASEDFAGETELQALRIRSGGDLRSNRLEQSAQLSRAAGRNAARAGLLRGGSLLIGGTADLWGGGSNMPASASFRGTPLTAHP